MIKKSKLLLIDGQGLAYRAFYALPSLKTSKGVPVNAVYGFTNMLLKVLGQTKPDYVACSFDKTPPTVRLEQYDQYKIHRQKQPEDLTTQILLIEDMLKNLQVSTFLSEGHEADDCLATLAVQGEKEGFEILILSGDLDFLQLVTQNISILAPKKGISDLVCYDEKKVFEHLGLKPKQLIDYKALAGDASDNIPGVPGVGKKTAVELLSKFETVDNILANINNLPERTKNLLELHKESLFLSKKLAVLQTDLTLDIHWEDCKLKEPRSEWIKFLEELEFKSLLKRLGAGFKVSEDVKSKIDLIKDLQPLQKFVKELKQHKDISVFFITDGALPHGASPQVALPRGALPLDKNLLGISLGCEKSTGFVLMQKSLSAKNALEVLKPILQDVKIKKIVFSSKEYYKILNSFDIDINKKDVFDVSLAAYLLDPEVSKEKLSKLAVKYLNLNLLDSQDILGKGVNAKKYTQISPDILAKLAQDSAFALLELAPLLEENLNKENLFSLYNKVELPLAEVLADMEEIGIKLDVKYLNKLSDKLERELKLIQDEIWKISGVEFNLNSPKQVGEVLFEKLKLPGAVKTKTGYKTDAEVLMGLALNYPIVQKLLNHRELSKLKSTYVDVFPKMIDLKTKRLHTTFEQTGTSTGRLSSANPNLQNIPIRTQWGCLIRKAFVSDRKNYVLISADYSQIELRILAHLSGDLKLKKAFEQDLDIHTQTAAEVFGLTPEEITPQLRRKAKEINFGINYGMSDYGLAQRLGIKRTQAQAYIEKYLKNHPGVKNYIDELIKSCEKTQYVATLLGRKRYIPDINSRNFSLRKAAQRMAMNAPIQGSAADIIKLAMIELYKKLKEADFPAKILLQVHDELILEAEISKLKEISTLVKDVMSNAYKLSAPLKVNLSYGKNWNELEEITQ